MPIVGDPADSTRPSRRNVPVTILLMAAFLVSLADAFLAFTESDVDPLEVAVPLVAAALIAAVLVVTGSGRTTKAQVRGRGVVAALGLLTVVLALARMAMR